MRLLSLHLSCLCLLVSCGTGDTSNQGIKVTIASTNAAPLEGETIKLTASHTGGSAGEPSYTWTQVSPAAPKGSFTSAAKAVTDFKVPPLCADAEFQLKVAVRDNLGNTAEQTFTFTATNQNDPFTVEPTISVGKAEDIAGEVFSMSIGAKGPGCGPKFSWSIDASSPGGAFEGDTSAQGATWRSPAQGGVYKINVTVTDEAGAPPETRSINLTVKQATFADVKGPLFSDNQAFCSGCHDGTATRGGGVDFSSDNVATTLAGLAVVADSPCKDQKYVDPMHPENSVLYKRIIGKDCGTQMPRNFPNFINANKNLVIRVQSWILGGGAF